VPRHDLAVPDPDGDPESHVEVTADEPGSGAGVVASGARVVVVQLPGTALDRPVGPPGVDPTAWTRALVEDTCELAAGLAGVVVVLAGDPAALRAHADLVWPGTPTVALTGTRTPLDQLLAAVAGAIAVVVLPPDVPDLPGLLVGKLFRDLGTADLALCPSAGGGLAAFGIRLPPADWVVAADPGPGSDPAVLDAAAPTPTSCRTVPGWHRLRRPGDLSRLDPGLEGWDSTRALLSGRPLG